MCSARCASSMHTLRLARLLQHCSQCNRSPYLCHHSPLPIALNLGGVRVKLPYERYKDAVKAVTFDEGVTLGEIATIMPSHMKDYILVRILPASETGYVF